MCHSDARRLRKSSGARLGSEIVASDVADVAAVLSPLFDFRQLLESQLF